MGVGVAGGTRRWISLILVVCENHGTRTRIRIHGNVEEGSDVRGEEEPHGAKVNRPA